MANYTINNLPNTVTKLNSADTLPIWDSANSKTAKISGSDLSNSILSNLVTISASSTTVTGLEIKNSSCVKIMFTSAITGSDTTTAMTITYNGTPISVKVGKQGSLSNFVASEVSSGVYKYLQAYTTLELIYDGTQFIIVGNPVVLSSDSYTIYADGKRESELLSDYESFTLTTTEQFLEYDGFIIFVSPTNNAFRISINDYTFPVLSYTINNRRQFFTIPVNKGDVVKVDNSSTDGYAVARWYK